MALKIVLKPGEHVLLGGAVIANGDRRSEFVVLNEVPVLRGADVLKAEEATTPARRLYFVLTRMYAEPHMENELQEAFQEAYRAVLTHRPVPPVHAAAFKILDEMLAGRIFKAMRAAKELIAAEDKADAEAAKSVLEAARARLAAGIPKQEPEAESDVAEAGLAGAEPPRAG